MDTQQEAAGVFYVSQTAINEWAWAQSRVEQHGIIGIVRSAHTIQTC